MNAMLAILFAVASMSIGDKTKITSASTYYDRKEGFAYFSGHVCVEDPSYKLHAERAYVYTDTTNRLKRIVALGNIALTNETRRAYGTKASYFADSGAVIVSASSNSVAEIRDETPKGTQIIRGRKMKFWVDSRQVEVLEAEMTAPVASASSLSSGARKRMVRSVPSQNPPAEGKADGGTKEAEPTASESGGFWNWLWSWL